MAQCQPLREWLREQSRFLGANSSGQTLSRKAFKGRLAARHIASDRSEEEMKQLWSHINTLYKEYSTTSRVVPDVNSTSQQDIARMTPRKPRKPRKPTINSHVASSSASERPEASNSYVEHDSGVDIRSSQSFTYGGSRVPGRGQQRSLNAKISELRVDAEIIHKTVDTRKERLPIPALVDQLQLLGLQNQLGETQIGGSFSNSVENAVVFSPEVLVQHSLRLFPQFSLLAGVCPDSDIHSVGASDPRLFLNTNIPFSAFICGLQGSGKSHTLATLLENCLIQSSTLGTLQSPLSALVFHFGQYTSRSTFWPCEVAFLAHPHPEFRTIPGIRSANILAAPSNYFNLSESYRKIPGVNVRPFKLRSKDLNVKSMLALMSVSQTKSAPLYMGQITRILREIASSSADEFDYNAFRELVGSCLLSRDQRCSLDQRLELLESFLDLKDETPDPHFESGSICIVDLSCPFIEANTACALFDIYLNIYLKSDPNVGKVIAIDEAHKYMTDTPASKAFTESLLTVIRQQRHIGARVIISTQEPAISPRLIDLCSILIVHRFSSPEWFSMIRKHVSISETEKDSLTKLFGRINDLRVGEGLMFAPSAVLSRGDKNRNVLFQLGSNLLKIKIRNRVTWDGGKSVVCV